MLLRLPADRPVDEELREPLRLCRADAGGLRRERPLRSPDVRTRAHHVKLELTDLLRRQEPVAAHGDGRELVVERTRHFAGEDRQRVLVRLLLRQQRRDARTRLLDDIGALVDRQLVADARVETRLQDVIGFGLQHEVRARDADQLLRRAEVDVLDADLHRQGDPGVVQRPSGGLGLGERGLAQTAVPAEDVQLPLAV